MKTDRENLFAAEAMPYLNELYRIAVRLAGAAEIAEDIVQEVFLQAWKSFDSYEKGTNCRAWLYKILFFKVKHYRRNVKIQAKYFQADDEEGTLFGQAVAPIEIPQYLTDEKILRAVDALPEKFRAVILLADVEDFDYKEVAQILNVPLGTVMSRLSRARQKLRKCLVQFAPEYGIKVRETPKKSGVLGASYAFV